MRKFPLWCLLCFLLLTDCGDAHKGEQESIKSYESCVDVVLGNKGSESKIIPSDYKLSVFEQKDNSYQYGITISNPRVAMYNIQAIAVDPALDGNSNAYPCLGLLEGDVETSFSIVLYRANDAHDFANRIFLDGISEHSQFTLQVIVTREDSKSVNTSRVLFTYNYVQKDNEADG